MNVAALGPNHKTAAKTNTSEIESRALIVGTLSVNDPVNRVNAARTTHVLGGGAFESATAECARAKSPATMTVPT
jgi:hypothetical protein